MDAERFDALTIRLQQTANRRRALTAMLAGPAELAGRQLSADAKKRRKRK